MDSIRTIKCILALALALIGHVALAQPPCVTIETIFVDACTLGGSCPSSGTPTCSCEGKNEMMRFRLGDSDQLLANLTVNWPNNSFLGFCQNDLTAQNTAELNETIEGCGWLVEPLDGVLPANSSVLVVTSADMCTEANSFAGLADTLYVIYQCPGNFQGHFANYGTGLRTTSMTFGGGCNSTVTYDRSLLVTQGGNPGGQDGASVDFTPDGTATYYNNGCTAPILPEIVDAGPDLTGCVGFEIDLNPTFQGGFGEFQWTGGSGTFQNPNQAHTTYIIGDDDEGTITLTLTAENCNGAATDEIQVVITEGPLPEITVDGDPVICPGDFLELEVSGSGTISWSSGQNTNAINISEPGIYTATLTNVCGSAEASVEIASLTTPELELSVDALTQLCEGEELTVQAVANDEVLWSDGSTGDSFNLSESGEYTASVTTECGTLIETFEVEVGELPNPVISPEELNALCEGDDLTVTVSGEGEVLWSTGETSSQITISEPGDYSVTLTNSCGSNAVEFNVEAGSEAPMANIEFEGETAVCAGETTTLNGTGNGSIIWSTGASSPAINVGPGTYVLIVTNECGSAAAEVTVDALPQPTISIDTFSPQTLCDGDVLVLNASSNGVIEWSDGSDSEALIVGEPGSYTATGTNDCGSLSLTIEVIGSPVNAFFTASPPDGQPPLNVVFENGSTNATAYEWFIDGESFSTDENPSWEFNTPGDYEVTLNATDEDGCVHSYTDVVTVAACDREVQLPNIFSPNNDGINDRFLLATECMREMQLSIYNRWGTLVFESNRSGAAWTGRDSGGNILTAGVYFAVLNYTDANGHKQILTSEVTLVR